MTDTITYILIGFVLGFFVCASFSKKEDSSQGLFNTFRKYHSKVLDVYSDMVFF